ncbi:hypothetical protein [Polaribacter sp. Hel1_85]|uniref:hypothetical protein n=1 Tax=Polaribacter sp. Hel1_85 TaxID=1250005 RepID=UPI00052CFDDA|nr:hypothetical protein [Polaribacter sp. Hel1_85]KGL58935.1 hypothetical protein PHEL85_3207 [Polaribacter sp. Hel1_85]
MKKICIVFLLTSIFSCKKSETKEVVIIESKTVKQSEMAALMLKMYDKNLENKKLVLKGETPKDFPDEFLNIHTAQLTDPSNRNSQFNAFSDFYLYSFQKVFNAPKDSLVLKHNDAVNSCISCHETTCVGPIPRIKKLLIK